MEVEVGDYIRLNDGQIIDITSPRDMAYLEECHPGIRKDIVKCSKKIIDLIEKGDYVNGYLVDFVQDNWIVYNHNHPIYLNILAEDIKSIVTKEQFARLEYKVGG